MMSSMYSRKCDKLEIAVYILFASTAEEFIDHPEKLPKENGIT